MKAVLIATAPDSTFLERPIRVVMDEYVWIAMTIFVVVCPEVSLVVDHFFACTLLAFALKFEHIVGSLRTWMIHATPSFVRPSLIIASAIRAHLVCFSLHDTSPNWS